LPSRVSADSAHRAQPGGFVDDSTVVAMTMSDGSIASIIYAASGDSSIAKERVEIFCDGSVASIDDFRSGSFVRNKKTMKFGGRVQDKGHAAEVDAFFDAVRNAVEPPIALESLIATSLSTFAIVESANNGASVNVNLNSISRPRSEV
jgi:predicted dehydrogenase